ncbi:MAG: hypothetical protein ACYC9J_13885 [Sulfuricaulis sp.]
MWKRRLDLWLPTYALSSPARIYNKIMGNHGTRHVIFLVCDHFEPRHGTVRAGQADERLMIWEREYASFQQRCRQAFGIAPKHTWFYPPHHGYEHLTHLARMSFRGLGEVELHYHHDKDNSASLRANLKNALNEYHRWGLLLASGEPPKTAFAFIHGDWALDNSAHGKFCGVNDELTILQELGCWGDFTMPSVNECQTRKINSIYYAVDNPEQPKSHDWGENVRVGRPSKQGLFMMQGPLGINWHAPRYPRIENASLTSANWGRPDRIRKWLDCHVHVRGRPEWVFIKLHTHGAIEHDFDALFGEKAFAMHRLLNQEYNDRERYCLHYVTAREAYNIAKAAEAGMTGDPAQYYDYEIPPYANTYYCIDAPHHLERCTRSRLKVSDIDASYAVQVRVKVGPLLSLHGRIETLDINTADGQIKISSREESARIELEADQKLVVTSIEGGQLLKSQSDTGDTRHFVLLVKKQSVVRFAIVGQDTEIN